MRTLAFNTFDGGMTNDPRDPRENVCRVVKHFDNYTRPHKLTPHRSMKKDAVTESTLDVYRIKLMVAANGTMWGLGEINGGVDAHTQVYTKTTPGDMTSVWTVTSGTGFSSSGTESSPVFFVVYGNYLYGSNSAGIWKCGDITSSITFTDNVASAVQSGIKATAQGLVHSKDNNLYVPSNNLILQNNAGSWTTALTFATGAVINSICEDGNFLDIAIDQPDGTCVVYRWDRDATLTILPEKIDWGIGSIKHIESIGGVLVGISVTSGSSNSLLPKIVFKEYRSEPVIFNEFICTGSITIRSSKQKFGNLFYFLAEITIDGTTYNGVWKIFKDSTGRMAVSFDRLPMNDTALTAGLTKGFYRYGDYMFVSFISPTTSLYTVWRTDDQPNFLATSIYETTINPMQPERYRASAGLRSVAKQILATALGSEPLTAGQSLVVKYKVEGGAWDTLFTASADGLTVREGGAYDAAGVAITSGREYEFRFESVGGAEITEWKYKCDINETLL